MRTLVSIIVPSYIKSPHEAALLAETLDTVSRQSPPYELIVVDDGSPVPIELVVSHRPRTTLIRQNQNGSAVARNTGIAASRGEYLIFLDGDDHLLPGAIDAGLAAFDAAPESGFVVGPREEMNYDGSPVPWAISPPPRQLHLYTPLLGFDWYIIPPSSAMFRRSVIADVGGFRDPWGADDLDFYLRAAHKYTAHCYQSPAVTRYRRYSASSSRDGERMLHSIRTVYARQWPIASADPITEAAFHRGLQQLTEIFLDCVVENVRDRVQSGERQRAIRSAQLLAAESPRRWEALMQDAAVAAALM